MANMLIDNHKQAITGLLQEGETLLQRIGDLENAKILRITRQE